MQLKNIEIINGSITLRTGLHIGAGDMEMHIGGTDNPVVTHPHTREPYIPGSSLKGKIRSLLELRSGLMLKTQGNPLGIRDINGVSGKQKEQAENILRLFGVSGADSEKNTEIGSTRASFADCALNDESRNLALTNNWPFIEIKTENVINRIKGTAEHPRSTERVPAGMVFDFSISLKIMDSDGDGEALRNLLLEGMKLLERDALGGSGSRGYGRIDFKFDDDELNKRFSGIDPFNPSK